MITIRRFDTKCEKTTIVQTGKVVSLFHAINLLATGLDEYNAV